MMLLKQDDGKTFQAVSSEKRWLASISVAAIAVVKISSFLTTQPCSFLKLFLKEVVYLLVAQLTL